jgi:hypothetical protein
MITGETQYNPDVHSNIPRNFRQWLRESKPNIPLTSSDEEIFLAWRDLYSVDDENVEHGLYGLMLEQLSPEEFSANLTDEEI